MILFDSSGHLTPYNRIEIDLKVFRTNFVDDFPESDTRQLLFENYLRYNEDLGQALKCAYYQYVNGSFVTKKRNPQDIDLVSFVSWDMLSGKEQLLEEKFLTGKAMTEYKMDAYLVVLYPSTHHFYSRTVSDIAYWNHWFGFSKFDHKRKRSPKGFLLVNFDQSQK